MPPRQLVLASASPARRRLLRDAGLDPIVIVSGVYEVVTDDAEPAPLVESLARLKATAVADLPAVKDEFPGAIVVGCDSMLEFDGALFGKPPTAEIAKQRWQRMRGHHGVLLTGHCVINAATGEQACGVARTTVRFGTPSAGELDAYIDSGEPLRVAGAFTLDGFSAPFIDGIDGDHGNVLGLSLPLLRRLLADLDIAITDLWC